MIDRKQKKAWLDNIYYNLGKQQYDYFLQYAKKNGIKTKWRRYSEAIFPIDFDGSCQDRKAKWFFDKCNQRQILPIEIALDLEEENQLQPTIKKLKEMDINFYVFKTGSRGYHIHLFFEKELTQEQKIGILNYFGADVQKAGDKTLIALEHAPHWKTGEIKQEVKL